MKAFLFSIVLFFNLSVIAQQKDTSNFNKEKKLEEVILKTKNHLLSGR